MLTSKEYLDIVKENPNDDRIFQHNKELIEKYPFLLPKNAFTGEVVEDYDYSWTELDELPSGWRIAFGEQMLEELREELIKFNFLDKYRIAQIKEKFGTLRWYDFGIPEGSKIYDIISKYENMSFHTCIDCGARYVPLYETKGWINYVCKSCVDKRIEKYNTFYKDNERKIKFEDFCRLVKEE